MFQIALVAFPTIPTKSPFAGNPNLVYLNSFAKFPIGKSVIMKYVKNGKDFLRDSAF